MLSVFVAVFCFASASAENAPVEEAILNSIELLDVQTLSDEAGIDFVALIRNLIGSKAPSISELLSVIRRNFADTLVVSVRKTFSGLIIPIASAFLMKCMISNKSGVRNAALLVCRLSCISVFAAVYGRSLLSAKALFEKILTCSEVLTPVMISATALAGAETTAAVLTPLSALSTEAIQNIMCRWGTALGSGAAGIAIANSLTDKFTMRRLQKLFRQSMNWITGLLMTGFMGMLAVQGRLSSGRDSMASRTAKYTIESIIPVVGGDVSNSLETLILTASQIKNAIGAAGLFLILAEVLLPLIEIVCSIFLFRITAAVAEPAGDDALTNLASDFSDAAGILLTSAIASTMLCALLIGSCMFAAGGLLR